MSGSRIFRVAKNSAILGLQQVAVNLLSIVVVGYVARSLGKVDYGIFSLAFTFSIFFAFLGQLGLRTLTIREVARERGKANVYLGKIIPARILLIGIMTAVIPMVAMIMQYDKKAVYIIFIAALANMFEQLSKIISDIFQANEEMGKVAVRDILVRIFTGVASIVVLKVGCGLVTVSWVYVIGAMLGLSFNAYLYNRRFEFPALSVDLKFIWTNIKEGLSFMLLGMASTMYTNVDVFLISKIQDLQSVGVYNAAANLFYRLSFVADAVATASFPAIAQLYWKDYQGASEVMSKSINGIILLSVPTAIGGWLLADDIILLIFGQEYLLSADVFKILIVSVPFLFISLQIRYSLGAIKLQGTVLKVVLVGLVVNIVLNCIVIPIYGVIGAACATLFTEILTFIWLAVLASKHFILAGMFRGIRLMSLPLTLMVLVVFLDPLNNIIIRIVFGALSYVGALYILGKDEISPYFKMLKK
ncbi:flippase [Desulfosediminicola flagellatus]|uniref:flippase n=1 Tax=Desulfosediminicola flagellatus TaxID=2569541 RepID=UPI0010AD7A44|nr:flippase [Desulfosediminicola flagellatus]